MHLDTQLYVPKPYGEANRANPTLQQLHESRTQVPTATAAVALVAAAAATASILPAASILLLLLL
jgi:hypothetical protein